jgi:Transposase DNA-binding/Transposase Tn5 dimerisation domain
MVVPWVMEETATVDLKDKRLNTRLREVLSQLGGHPTASIPAACGGHAEMTAAYRLFDNEKATWARILEPHTNATRQRMAHQAVVVLGQDTTEVDVTRPEQQVAGAGPLDEGARRGVLLHPLHAFTPDGTPLGTLHALAWVRKEEDASASNSKSKSRSERAAIPIEKKESYRWVQMLRWAGEEKLCCPSTQLVCVADSEADIYELLVEGAAEPRRVDWIVRACQDRALLGENGQAVAGRHVREEVLAQPVLFPQTIQVRGRKAKVACETRGRRQPRESRRAEVEVRAARVTLRPPWRADRKLPEVTVNVVLVREVDPPKDDEPVEWLLLTSLPVDDVEQVRRVVQYYCVRWMLEVFFRVLKSGCRVEERRFEHIHRLLSCLAVYMIVAWRTLFLCRLGRGCPEISCEAVFEPAEWKSVWKVVHRTDPPSEPPRLGEMVRLVAQLGGYVNRRRSDPPGPQTIWIGLQRMHDFALCWQLFGPDGSAETATCVEQRGLTPWATLGRPYGAATKRNSTAARSPAAHCAVRRRPRRSSRPSSSTRGSAGCPRRA